jgi:hypothetical protein
MGVVIVTAQKCAQNTPGVKLKWGWLKLKIAACIQALFPQA